MMLVYLLSKLVYLVFGTLYPTYCSYKAIKSKDAKQYVRWMKYWVIFVIYSSFESILDIFVGIWCPFYYEIKIGFLAWMLSPMTRGSSVMYRHFLQPFLERHEPEIDSSLVELKSRTSNVVVRWASRTFSTVVDYVTSVAFRGGGGVLGLLSRVNQTQTSTITNTNTANHDNYGSFADADPISGNFGNKGNYFPVPQSNFIQASNAKSFESFVYDSEDEDYDFGIPNANYDIESSPQNPHLGEYGGSGDVNIEMMNMNNFNPQQQQLFSTAAPPPPPLSSQVEYDNQNQSQQQQTSVPRKRRNHSGQPVTKRSERISKRHGHGSRDGPVVNQDQEMPMPNSSNFASFFGF